MTEEEGEEFIQQDAPDRRKDQPCRYWFSGKCKFGENCRFSHDVNASSFVMVGGAYYYHSPETSLPAEAAFARSTMITPCKFFYQGKCKYGYNCRFSHLQPSHTPSFSYPMFPFLYYGGYPVYHPSNELLCRSHVSIEQDDINHNNNYQFDIEGLKADLHLPLSRFQQQFYQYKDRSNHHNSTKSLNEIALALQELSASFIKAIGEENQQDRKRHLGNNVISHLKSLLPNLTEEDIEQIEDICCNRGRINGQELENVSSLTTKVQQATVKEPIHSQENPSPPEYAPNSYAAALCKNMKSSGHQYSSKVQ